MEGRASRMDRRGLYVGVDLGSVSLNCVVIDPDRSIVYEHPYSRHFGQVEEQTISLMEELYRRFGEERIRCVSFTGNHGKKISEMLGVYYEFDTISQALGAVALQPDVRTIISMGGQDTAFMQIRHHQEGEHEPGNGWGLEFFNTNGPCASGTGSFIDQQAQRLATSMYSEERDGAQGHIDEILKDFVALGGRSRKPANVACRCTVFTKSDMIHLQNKGEKLEDIVYGLHVGNARNYMSTIVCNREVQEPVIFIGGLSLNELQVHAFRSYFPHLEVPQHSTSIGALGVALQGLEIGGTDRPDLGRFKSSICREDIHVPVAPRLVLRKTAFPEDNDIQKRISKQKEEIYLGVDIGSTTTKYAVINENREITHKNYVPTQGKPVEVTQRLLSGLKDAWGDNIAIKGVATTGSGRNVVGDFLNADLIIDEITAHARGAVEINPEVDTIFEIGGQDSKYIYIAKTYPLDFDMNKVCAAGTGSFLHELANKYGVNIVKEFQEIALSSGTPVKLAERCTVFMESDLVSYHQKGLKKTDLIAGLCYAIVYNYLNRVVGKRKVGKTVMFLGGPSLNKGVVAAFENVLGRELLIPKHREVLGAYGAAISVQEKMRDKETESSVFRGIDSAIRDKMTCKEKVCKADPNCHNQCKLKIYDFDGRKSIWGGECGRYEITKFEGTKKENYFDLRRRIWESYLDGVSTELKGEPIMEVEGRPTVGMQRALYGFQTGILWAHFFDQLGFRLVLTPPTTSRISQTGVESMSAETCYPVKISHGHIKDLLGKTRHLFIPTMITMATQEASEVGFYCPMVQSNSYMVQAAFGIDAREALAPIVHMKWDPDTLSREISEQISGKLKVGRRRIREALIHALEIHDSFERDLKRKGDEILKSIGNDEPVVVVSGRPYNLYDERVNLRLGQNLAKIGINAIPMDLIDVSSVDLSDFPSMYWGLGAQILRSARFARQRSNCFGLHITNFSCGADSFIEHFYKYIMGDKAYLILELDEHSAVAGVMTRLEAYKNVVENAIRKAKSAGAKDMDLRAAN